MAENEHTENLHAEEGAEAGDQAVSRRLWVRIVAAAVVLLFAGGFGVQIGRLDSGRRSRAALARAEIALDRVDPVILEVDAVVETTVTAQATSKARDANGDVPEAEAEVRRAVDVLDDAETLFDVEHARQARDLRLELEDRAALLSEAATILPVAEKAAEAAGPMRQAWDSLSQASQLSNTAARRYNEHTKAGVAESTRLTRLALGRLSESLTRLTTVKRAWREPDLTGIESYVRKRQALANRSLEIDRVWLSGRTDQANRMLDEYSSEQARDESAFALPSSDVTPLLDAYQRLVGASLTRYSSIRSGASIPHYRLAGGGATKVSSSASAR